MPPPDDPSLLIEFEHHWPEAKAASPNGIVNKSDQEPHPSGNLGGFLQPPPDGQAEQEAERRSDSVRKQPFLSSGYSHDIVLLDNGEIHAHESQECAKVENLSSDFII